MSYENFVRNRSFREELLAELTIVMAGVAVAAKGSTQKFTMDEGFEEFCTTRIASQENIENFESRMCRKNR